MKCSFCKKEIPDGSSVCPLCGDKSASAQNQIVMSDKSRIKYALFGFFLGNFGVHDFYIGRSGRAVGNIIGNVLVSPFLVQISTGFELLTTQKDSDGKILQGSPAVPIILGILLIIIHLTLGTIVLLALLGAAALS